MNLDGRWVVYVFLRIERCTAGIAFLSYELLLSILCYFVQQAAQDNIATAKAGRGSLVDSAKKAFGVE